MSILKKILKINPLWSYTFILILTSLLSFGLGRLSGKASAQPEIRIDKRNLIEQKDYSLNFQSKDDSESGEGSNSTRNEQALLVGSINSDKYHYPWCPGAQRIKDSNKIWFASVQEAREEGYEPAGNCEGLE